MKGFTKSGFEFEIAEGLDDDYEVFEIICAVDNGEIGKLPALLDALLGKKQAKELKEHLREKGRVSTQKILDEVQEIFEKCNEIKN